MEQKDKMRKYKDILKKFKGKKNLIVDCIQTSNQDFNQMIIKPFIEKINTEKIKKVNYYVISISIC